ncbi:MAG: hypothetical protein K6G90_02155 [Clostridia bacterium]|nr:hypothetical protein [Clostridia bacterium]
MKINIVGILLCTCICFAFILSGCGVKNSDTSEERGSVVDISETEVKKLSKSDEQQTILNMSWQEFRMNYFYPAEIFYHILIPFNGGDISVDDEHYYDSDGNLLDSYRDDCYYRIDDPEYPDKQALHDACCKYLSEAYVDNAEKESAPFFEKDGQLFIKESYLFGDSPGVDLYKLFSVKSYNDDEIIVNIKCYWDEAHTDLWRDADYKMIYENGNWVFDSFEQIF